MSKVACPVRTAITSMKTGKNILDESKLEEGNQGIVVPLAMIQSSDSIWSRLSTTSVWVAIRGPRKKRKRRVPLLWGMSCQEVVLWNV